MLHVFVETNWVVDYAAPAHYRMPTAARLFERAQAGEIKLHLPSLCVAEARRPILAKHRPRHAETIQKFLKWAKRRGLVSVSDDIATRRVIQNLDDEVRRDLEKLDQLLASLSKEPGIEVFAVDAAMLERAAGFSLLELDLQLFDQAVLATVLTRAEALKAEGQNEIVFCELDSHLQPWDKQDKPKQVLTSFLR